MRLFEPILRAFGVLSFVSVAFAAGPDAFRIAELALNDGRVDDATAVMQAVLDANPQNGDAMTILGNIAMLRGDAKKAAEYYYAAVDSDPGRADFHNNVALHELRCGAFDKAYDSLLTANRLDQNHVPTLYNLGTMLLTSRDPLPAAEYFRKAISVDPNHAPSHYKLGALYMLIGETDEAIREYEAAVKIDPSFVDARVDLGIALLQQGEVHVAASHFRIAAEQDPNKASAHYGLGLAMQQWGYTQSAIDRLTKAVELAPENADYHIDLGLTYLESGAPDAVTLCEQQVLQSLAVQPDHVRANYMAGLYYSDAGKPQLAVSCLQHAIDLGNKDPDTRLTLAVNLLKVGNNAKAKTILQELVRDLPPENEIRGQAQALLKNT